MGILVNGRLVRCDNRSESLLYMDDRREVVRCLIWANLIR